MRATRLFTCLVGAAASMPAAVVAAEAAGDFPVRAVRMFVPYAPGGPIEVVGRLIGQRLSDQWGRPVVVDNRPAPAV